MKNSILITFFLLAVTMTSFSQGGYSTFSYTVGFPAADMSDFTETVSGRGIAFDHNYQLNDNMSIGLGLGWQVFTENLGYQTNVDGTASLSGNVYHYVNSFPIHVTGTYFLNGDEIKPFIGLGVGTIYNMTDADIGVFRFEDNAWQFSLRPEAGVQFELNYRTGIRISARYNHALETSELGSFSYLALGAGIVWMY